MCKNISCKNCPIANVNNDINGHCYVTGNINQEMIDAVQKWSDSNPEVTRREKFEQMMCDARLKYKLCKYNGGLLPKVGCAEFENCIKCIEYWNAPYVEERHE